jgi:hypothetical protein
MIRLPFSRFVSHHETGSGIGCDWSRQTTCRREPNASAINGDGSLARGGLIDPFPQFFPGFKEWKLFGADENPCAGLGVASGVALIFFNKKTAQTADFDPVTPGHGVGHMVEKYMYHLGRIRFGDIGFVFQGGYELQFVHTASFGCARIVNGLRGPFKLT